MNAMRGWTAGILAAILTVAAAAAGDAPGDADRFWNDMREGREILRAGDPKEFPGAVGRFREAKKLRPDNPDVYFWMGLAYSDSHSYNWAAENARDAVNYSDDQMANAWLLWGQALLYQGEYADACVKLKKARDLAQNDPLVLFNLGRALFHGGGDPKADYTLFLFKSVSESGAQRTRPELFPVVVQAQLYMAYCHEAREEWDLAILIYKNVQANYMEYLPDGAGNLDLLARLAAATRLAERPNEPRTLYQELLGRLQNLPRDLPQEKKIQNQRLLADTHFRLGHLYLTDRREAKPELALLQFREFLALNPEWHPQYEMVRDFVNRYDARGGR